MWLCTGGKVKLQWSGGSNIHATARGGSEETGGDWNRRAACCLGLRPDSRDLVVGMEDGTLYHTPRCATHRYPRGTEFNLAKSLSVLLSRDLALANTYMHACMHAYIYTDRHWKEIQCPKQGSRSL